jgi:hypothetical protein
VLATDPETGLTEARPVTELIRHSGEHTMVEVTLDDGSVIQATDRHPFWDATTRAFVYAIDLKAGDQVLSADGRRLTIRATRVYKEDLTAFNLAIDGIHTYYAGNTPVLVHNTCDLAGIEHAISNHTRAGPGYISRTARGEKVGLFDDGLDFNKLAPLSDGLEGTPQTGHSSLEFIVDSGQLVGTAGNGMLTSTIKLIRDRITGDLITMHPFAR